MHMSKREIGLIGTYSIVAAGIPSAVGLGLASKLAGRSSRSLLLRQRANE